MTNLNIYINKTKENWIVDRLREEFTENNPNIVTSSLMFSNLVWIFSPWTWHQIRKSKLMNNKVLCTIHHIDESKFDLEEKNKFYDRDKYVDAYHVNSPITKEQIQKLTDKKIYYIPFWIDEKKWPINEDKSNLFKKFEIPNDSFVVGSFQRDSEGHDVKLPKLSKGPDQFIEIVKNYKEKYKNNLIVILTGKRRDYLINELSNNDINYKYFEMVDQRRLNDLYNLLDLYIVSSRFEGGPFAIYECAITKTPIISTDVGIARLILSKESIYNMKNYENAKPNVEFAYQQIKNYSKEKIMPEFIKMFHNLYEN